MAPLRHDGRMSGEERRRHHHLILCSAIATALIAGSAATPAGATARAAAHSWTITLPEKDGVSALAADARRAYVVWADTSKGHSAAFTASTGALGWHRATAPFADDISPGDGVVWTTDRGTLVEQRSSSGRRLATITIGRPGIVTLAADGADIETLSDGSPNQILRTYDTSGLVDRHSTPIPSTSECHVATSGPDLYALCIGGQEAWKLYRLDVSTGKAIAKRRLSSATDGGPNIACAAGHVYVLQSTGPGGLNTTPAEIVQMSATTLALQATSPSLDLTEMALAGDSPVGLEVNAHDEPTGVAVFSGATMQRQTSVSISDRGTALYLAADRTTAFVVVYPPTKKQVPEQLIGLPLDASAIRRIMDPDVRAAFGVGDPALPRARMVARSRGNVRATIRRPTSCSRQISPWEQS